MENLPEINSKAKARAQGTAAFKGRTEEGKPEDERSTSGMWRHRYPAKRQGRNWASHEQPSVNLEDEEGETASELQFEEAGAAGFPPEPWL